MLDTLAKLEAAVRGALGLRPPRRPLPVVPPPQVLEGVTAKGLSALVGFVGPLVRIVEGKGTLSDDVQAANAVMDAIALIDPAAAPIMALIEDAEPAFTALVGLAKTGGFQLSGGYIDVVGQENDTNFKNR